MKRSGKFLGIIVLVLFTGVLFAIAQEKPQVSQNLTRLSGEWKCRIGLGTVEGRLKINVSSDQIQGEYLADSQEYNASGSVKEEGGQLIIKITLTGGRSLSNPEFHLVLESKDMLSGKLLSSGGGYYDMRCHR